MADIKILDLTTATEITETTDYIPVVDTSDTTQDSTGTTKKATVRKLLGDRVLPDTIVGTTEIQTLSGKTIDGDDNTISNLAHGLEVDNPSSGVHGVTGSIVGTTDTQTLTNKTLTSPKINEDVALTSTSTELNALDGKMGAWTSFTPTIGSTAGTITTKAGAGYYIQLGKTVSFQVLITVTTNGTGSGALTCTLPVTAARVGFNFSGREVNVSGKTLSASVLSTTVMNIYNYDNSYPVANGAACYIAGVYEAA